MREACISECRIIKQNCEYTAETHHIIAHRFRSLSIWFAIIPAAVAAVSGALIGAGVIQDKLLWLTVMAAVVTVVANVLDPNKNQQDHLNAAKLFTALKHDARALADTFSNQMSDEVLAVEVKHLHERYNDLLKSVPPTDDKAFEKARQKIQAGRHNPDRDSNDNIPK